MTGRSGRRTYGTVSADRQKEMSGLAFVRGLADGTLPLNTIAETLGYDVAEVEAGRVVVTAAPGLHLRDVVSEGLRDGIEGQSSVRQTTNKR